jgi:hypothetical protein
MVDPVYPVNPLDVRMEPFKWAIERAIKRV